MLNGSNTFRRLLTSSLMLAALPLIFLQSANAGAGKRVPAYKPGTVLVAFKEGATFSQKSQLLRHFEMALDEKVKSPYFSRFHFNPSLVKGRTFDSVIASLRGNAAVRIAEPDYIVHTCDVPNDPMFPDMWALQNTGQAGGTANVA